MTIKRVVGIPSGQPQKVGELGTQYPDGAADLQVPNPTWQGRNVAHYSDTTLLPDTTHEGNLLADGGMLAQASPSMLDSLSTTTNRYATFTATNVPGRNGFTLPTSGTNAAYAKPTWAIDGIMHQDEWTITVPIKCRGADLTTITTSQAIVFAGAGQQQLTVTYTGGNLITAQISIDERNFLVAGANKTLTATVAVASGDFPSNTWTNVTVAFDKTYGLIVITGSGNPAGTPIGRTGTAVTAWSGAGASMASLSRCWSSEPTTGGGLILGGAPGAGANPPDWGVDFGVPRVDRYSRWKVKQAVVANGSSQLFVLRKPATVTIDASTATGSWYPNIGMVVDQHSNYGGADPNPIRDRQLDLLASAGCPGMRFGIAGAFGAGGGSITTLGSLTNTGGGMDFTLFDPYFQRYASRGLSCEFGITYTDPALRSGGSAQGTLPTSNANYATWASALIYRLNSLGVTLAAITGWNEPELTLGSGQVTAYRALWTACRNKLATDHPTKPLLSSTSSVQGVHFSTFSGNYLKGTIDEAVAQGFSMPLACFHGYHAQNSLTYLVEEIDAIRAYLDSVGLTATKIAVPEFNGFYTHQQPGGGDDMFVLAPWKDRMHEASFVHASLAEMANKGVTMATYYRLGGSPLGNDAPGLLAGTDEGITHPRPYPAFHAYECIWKHAPNAGSGAPTDVNKVTATSNWPGVRVLASKSPTGRVVVSYSSLRVADGASRPKQPIQFDWTAGAGLPTTYTWKQYRVDDEGTGRLSVVAQGDESNLPTRAEIGPMGVGCIEITP